ncbi:MAG: hypothetical protein AABW99_01580, partial [archaeon]
DTPDWFHSLGLDSSGKSYGIGKLFSDGKINFANRYFDSGRLSGAGVHEVLISVAPSNNSFRFFNSNGEPNVNLKVQLYLLKDPNPNSVFYSLPLDGLVGLEGNSFNRQGYGVAFSNKDATEFVSVNGDAQPFKTYTDSGSNPVAFVGTDVDTGFFSLNSSPSKRGNLLIVERTSSGQGDLKFQPSKATPVVMKVTAKDITEERLGAFYSVSESNVPVEVGSTMTFWSGAGACLDFSGSLVTDSFDNSPDRAATSKDALLNWQHAYGIDFGKVNYAGDVYLRTIFYTPPGKEMSLGIEAPEGRLQFLTPDNSGAKVALNGVSGTQFNNPSGGSLGNVQSIEDVFGLVRDQRVCVVDSGRKASFFWNPKSVYELSGTQRNISDLTNSLEAGKTCIGYGG